MTRVLFSNMGYARGINGSLRHHVLKAGRHIYASPAAQMPVLAQLKAIIAEERPDVCGLVEIDSGSFHSGRFNQLKALLGDGYDFFDIAGKYNPDGALGKMPFHKGKSNAFIAREDLPFERHYFRNGAKRLVYSVALPDGIRLFFAHFSLKRAIRALQMEEMRALVESVPGEAIVLADFNIMHGFSELRPMLLGGMKVMNGENDHTFMFHRRRLALDLCLCTPGLAERITVRIVPQPFSDHEALVVDIG